MDSVDTIRSELDDASLAAAHQRGEPWAFRALFERHQGWVFNLAYQMVRSRDEAADLTQEIFLRVHRSLPTLKAHEAFLTWLRRIAVNACKDYLKRRRVATAPLEQRGDDGESETRDLPDASADPARGLLDRELRGKLEYAIASLSDDHRAVVVMHHLQGMEVAEIARIMKCSVGTVKSRLSRARAALREYLRGYVEE
jgi:RNA polymerase sigma-70 factor (ECF subfamily)